MLMNEEETHNCTPHGLCTQIPPQFGELVLFTWQK